MELIDDAGHRAMRLAQVLGLAQEALRLGCNVIATEHLLMATLCDPVIRWKVKDAGVDMRDVQALVRRCAERRIHGQSRVAMTAEAADVLLEAGAAAELDPDRRPAPRVYSATMVAVMMTLLRDDRDSTARHILTALGLLDHTASLLDALQDSAAASLLLPSLPLTAPPAEDVVDSPVPPH